MTIFQNQGLVIKKMQQNLATLEEELREKV